MSDKDIISPYDISTILNSKQMRIAKTIKTRLSLSANSQNKLCRKCMANNNDIYY